MSGPADSREPIRLLALTNSRGGVGGADRDLVNLFNALGPERIRVAWAGVSRSTDATEELDAGLLLGSLDTDAPLFTYLLQENAEVRRSPARWARIVGRHLLACRRPTRSVLTVAQDLDVDLVLSSTTAVTYGPAIARRLGVPHVWLVKEWLDPRQAASRVFARFIQGSSSAVTVPSRAMADVFDAGVRVVPDGTDVRRVRAAAEGADREGALQALGLDPRLPLVVQVGAVLPWKGQRVTARAFSMIARGNRIGPFNLLFLGEGADRDAVTGILEGAPDPWRRLYRFSVFPPGDVRLLSMADVVVHPSVLPDPYPNAVREALTLGRAVVASGSGGIPDLIVDGERGRLVRPGDAEALAGALSGVLEDPVARRRMGEAARRWAEEHVDVTKTAGRFHELFQEVL